MSGRVAESTREAAVSNIKRILSIDGGGIKGACPIGFLEQVETITRQRIVDHFDLVVGTCTGGIIALGLGLGLPAARLLSFYRDDLMPVEPATDCSCPPRMCVPLRMPRVLRVLTSRAICARSVIARRSPRGLPRSPIGDSVIRSRFRRIEPVFDLDGVELVLYVMLFSYHRVDLHTWGCPSVL